MSDVYSRTYLATLNRAWEGFVRETNLDRQIVRPEISRSWERCSRTQLNPFGKYNSEVLNFDDFDARKKSHSDLIRVAVPLMRMLVETCGEDIIAILTDEEGYILDLIGKDGVLTSANKLGVFKGANLSENVAGTGTTGIILIEKQPLEVIAHEHYLQFLHGWACSAAPIFNPAGHLIGVLNICGSYGKVHPNNLAMVILASMAIGSQLQLSTLREHQPIHSVTKNIGRARFTFDNLIGASESLLTAVSLAKRASASSSTVLLQGESGTGKELFAQAIHSASKRAVGPFIVVNCATIPRELIESELFGYDEGAFTGARRGGNLGKFELASRGTIFLDEIGDMPLDLQVSLLRFLQEKQVTRLGGRKVIPVDVRIIAATHRDLREEIAKGKFREDLFYRLFIINIKIPPLRERPGDVPLLANHFIRKIGPSLGKKLVEISQEAMNSIMEYTWPGNVRELENALERAINITPGNQILQEHLPETLASSKTSPMPNPETCLLSLGEIERAAIINTIQSLKGNITQAARVLGVTRVTLYNKIKQYGING